MLLCCKADRKTVRGARRNLSRGSPPPNRAEGALIRTASGSGARQRSPAAEPPGATVHGGGRRAAGGPAATGRQTGPAADQMPHPRAARRPRLKARVLDRVKAPKPRRGAAGRA